MNEEDAKAFETREWFLYQILCKGTLDMLEKGDYDGAIKHLKNGMMLYSKSETKLGDK